MTAGRIGICSRAVEEQQKYIILYNLHAYIGIAAVLGQNKVAAAIEFCERPQGNYFAIVAKLDSYSFHNMPFFAVVVNAACRILYIWTQGTPLGISAEIRPFLRLSVTSR